MNLDIEGTKHEKVVIIVLSYVMGFTAGFICFGITMPRTHSVEAVPAEISAVADEMPNLNEEIAIDDSEITETDSTGYGIDDQTAAVAQTTAGGTTVAYEDGMLRVMHDNTSTLLSVKKDVKVPTADFYEQGSHSDIPYFALSPNKAFVYFCEEKTIAGECTSFVYDVAGNTIHYVSADGAKLHASSELAKTAVWTEAGLTLDGMVSASPDAPAALTRAN